MLISDLPIIMLRNLLFTIIVEIIISFILGFRRRDLLNILLVNILTNPLLNSLTVYIDFQYGLMIRNIALVLFEIVVVIIEGFIYQKYLNNKKINGYLLSLILNTSSFIFGMIINLIIY